MKFFKIFLFLTMLLSVSLLGSGYPLGQKSGKYLVKNSNSRNDAIKTVADLILAQVHTETKTRLDFSSHIKSNMALPDRHKKGGETAMFNLLDLVNENEMRPEDVIMNIIGKQKTRLKPYTLDTVYDMIYDE